MPESFPSVESLIPHRAPMCLLRRVLALDGERVQVECRLPKDSPVLAHGAGAQAWSIEITAQAAAAFIGYHHCERGWRSGRLIKATRWALEAESLPAEEELLVYSKLDTWSESGVFRFDGWMENSEGKRLAGGQLTIFAS